MSAVYTLYFRPLQARAGALSGTRTRGRVTDAAKARHRRDGRRERP